MSDTLPYKIAVLCDLRDAEGRVLMLHRAKDPNKGLYSPIGGKLETAIGESPAQCAQREIFEEAGIKVSLDRLRLVLMVSERAYENKTHWLMFVYRVEGPVEVAEQDMDEGRLSWFSPEDVEDLPRPETDAMFIWPRLRDGGSEFVSMHIDCRVSPPLCTIE